MPSAASFFRPFRQCDLSHGPSVAHRYTPVKGLALFRTRSPRGRMLVCHPASHLSAARRCYAARQPASASRCVSLLCALCGGVSSRLVSLRLRLRLRDRTYYLVMPPPLFVAANAAFTNPLLLGIHLLLQQPPPLLGCRTLSSPLKLWQDKDGTREGSKHQTRSNSRAHG